MQFLFAYDRVNLSFSWEEQEDRKKGEKRLKDQKDRERERTRREFA
jgi:hypothetical protein